MKRIDLLLVLLAINCVAVGVHAEVKKFNFFGAMEYLTYSDAFEQKENQFNGEVEAIRNSLLPSDSITSNTKSAGGVGFRIGALAAVPVKGLQIGGSLGYIMGPSFEGRNSSPLYAYDVLGDPVRLFTVERKVEDKSSLSRLMAESKYEVPLGEKLRARLGFGIGIATLHLEEKTSDQIVGGSMLNSESHSLNTTKMTWEIGPAIAYVTKKVGVELAVTYAHMPSAENKNTFQEFKWNPFGIRLGVEF